MNTSTPREKVQLADKLTRACEGGVWAQAITLHDIRQAIKFLREEATSEKGGSTADKRDAARWRFLEHGCQWVGFGFTPTGGADRLEPNTEGFRYVLMWMDHLIERQLDADQSYLLEWRQFVSDCQTLLASPARGEVSEEMVERALDAAKGRMVDTRRFWTDDDRVAVRAMLEAANEII